MLARCPGFSRVTFWPLGIVREPLSCGTVSIKNGKSVDLVCVIVFYIYTVNIYNILNIFDLYPISNYMFDITIYFLFY